KDLPFKGSYLKRDINYPNQIIVINNKNKIYNTMKKLLLMSCAIFGFLLLFSSSSLAQQGRIQIGPGLAYGTEVENLGISVDGYYTINEQFRAGVGLTYFLPKSDDFGGGSIDYNYFAVDLNGNYIFHNEDKLMAYALAGLN